MRGDDSEIYSWEAVLHLLDLLHCLLHYLLDRLLDDLLHDLFHDLLHYLLYCLLHNLLHRCFIIINAYAKFITYLST